MPEGAEDNAAPIKNANIVAGAKDLLHPAATADNGPISVRRVEVESVRAQHKASFIISLMLQPRISGYENEAIFPIHIPNRKL